MEKIALVTGTNRGIGLEISKQLAANGITVIMTARNMHIGRPLVNELRKRWKNIWYHQLDVTDETSIIDLYHYLDGDCGKLDILVNNAGVYLDENQSILDVDLDTMKATMAINFYGPLRLVQVLLPLLNKSNDPRIINLSSTMGQLTAMGSGSAAYRISKTALNTLTVILSNELAGTGVKINSVHPGWVKTDMGGPVATRSIPEGAETIVWLATADEIPNGKFVYDRKIIDW